MILHLLVEFAGYLLVLFYVKKYYFYEKSNQILAILKIKNYVLQHRIMRVLENDAELTYNHYSQIEFGH